ncbi:unnamed protein product [Toxocara canis]|uniref:Transposase n=1 Tax=Toxocara canis TaxID=6265 RepID=A0A183UP93_TOXCA|nr:unnamed protein product [Toxocara canis]
MGLSLVKFIYLTIGREARGLDGRSVVGIDELSAYSSEALSMRGRVYLLPQANRAVQRMATSHRWHPHQLKIGIAESLDHAAC